MRPAAVVVHHAPFFRIEPSQTDRSLPSRLAHEHLGSTIRFPIYTAQHRSNNRQLFSRKKFSPTAESLFVMTRTPRLPQYEHDVRSRTERGCPVATPAGQHFLRRGCQRHGGPSSVIFRSRDIQLQSVRLDDVLEKRRLDQALNAKEFSVLAGVSYSTAREWFRSAGFPQLRGFVFWTDFMDWRREQTGISNKSSDRPVQAAPTQIAPKAMALTPQADRILAEAG